MSEKSDIVICLIGATLLFIICLYLAAPKIGIPIALLGFYSLGAAACAVIVLYLLFGFRD